jgi:hypothetical protein
MRGQAVSLLTSKAQAKVDKMNAEFKDRVRRQVYSSVPAKVVDAWNDAALAPWIVTSNYVSVRGAGGEYLNGISIDETPFNKAEVIVSEEVTKMYHNYAIKRKDLSNLRSQLDRALHNLGTVEKVEANFPELKGALRPNAPAPNEVANIDQFKSLIANF